MKTLRPQTKSKRAKKVSKKLFASFHKLSSTLKSQHFRRSPPTLDVTDIVERNTEIERQSKLPVAVYFPPND
jgi:hypothetical protein